MASSQSVKTKRYSMDNKGKSKKRKQEDLTYVTFDLEATGLSVEEHIIQIAAVGPDSEFSKYVLPEREMTEGALRVTGLKKRGRHLYRGEVKLPAVSIKDALFDFIDYLRTIKQPVLVAHNCFGFDSRLLLLALERVDLLESFKQCVPMFMDTLPLSKEIIPGRDSYSQKNLAASLLDDRYDAHDALNDAQCLCQLLAHFRQKSNCSPSVLMKHSMNVASAKEAVDRFVTLQPLVSSGAIKSWNADAIVRIGLCLNDLRSAYENGRKSALSTLLAEVIWKGTIIDSICRYFMRESGRF